MKHYPSVRRTHLVVHIVAHLGLAFGGHHGNALAVMFYAALACCDALHLVESFRVGRHEDDER